MCCNPADAISVVRGSKDEDDHRSGSIGRDAHGRCFLCRGEQAADQDVGVQRAGRRQKGDERKAFMKECLSTKKETPQQAKMKSCNAEAKEMKATSARSS
jgi:hypothetical protein